MHFSSSSTASGTLLLTLLASTNALPSINTFRGGKVSSSLFSREHFVSEVLEAVPNLPNPRDYGAHTSERSHPELDNWVAMYGYGEPSKPSQISTLFNSFLSKTEAVFKLTEELISSYSHLLSPYVSEKQKYIPNLTFSKSKWWNNGLPQEEDFDASANPNLPPDSGFDYGNVPVRGVNIGNWLLVELWMDSTLTAALNNHAVNAPFPNPIVDEWTAGQYSTVEWATHVLEKHFDTWMVEDDWKNIAAAGLNHVRIPVPHFAFPETIGFAPYLALNRFEKLKEGVLLAKKYGLKVWIDLHSVPGSQNGYDNSGRATGNPRWATRPEYYTRTKYALDRLINEFSQDIYNGTVTAIEPVNEPWGKQDGTGAIQNLLNDYYRYAHNAIGHPNNQTEPGTLLMAAHDGFQGLQYWQDFWSGIGRHRVLLDTHPYFVYSDYEKRSKDKARLKEVCDLADSFTQSQKYYPSIAGEMASNGPNGDNFYDRDLPVGPVKFPQDGTNYPYSVKYMAFMALNFATQRDVFEAGGSGGWIFWAWRNDNVQDWNYQTGLKYGWIPKDLDAKPYGENICTGYLHKIGAT